jgi:hypothetical protein
MTWKNYLELSEKTLSQEFFVTKRDELLLHAVMGIITELEELSEWNGDDVNQKEEVADVLWYMAILDRELGLNLNIDCEGTDITGSFLNEAIIYDCYKQSSLLLDFLKKKLYYNKEINIDEFSSITHKLHDKIKFFSKMNEINLPDILNTNITKLKARYGDKFSSEKAINRDLKTERNILESGEN